jgi:hypothetical protein
MTTAPGSYLFLGGPAAHAATRVPRAPVELRAGDPPDDGRVIPLPELTEGEPE